MPKPFANAPLLSEEVLDNYLLALQAGTDPDGPGLAQMRKVSAAVLRSYFLTGFGALFNFREGSWDSVPENLAVNDCFYAGADFTDAESTVYAADGTTSHNFLAYHFYAWNGEAWFDITKAVLENYPPDQTIASLVSRTTQNEADIADLDDRVEVLSGGDSFRGSVATVADLPAASSANQNHKFWVVAQNAYYMSNGTAWVQLTGSYFVYDGLDSESTTNALSANKGHELHQKIGPFDFRNKDPNPNPIFEGNLAKTWEGMFKSIPKESNAMVTLEMVPNAPASSSAAGDPGDVAADSDYMYVCVATNTWVRFAITTSF